MTLQDIPNLDFRNLAASLDPALEPSSQRSFELCLGADRLPVRVSLHPNQRRVVTQAYVGDLAMVLGDLRAALLPCLLLLNQASIQGGSPVFSLALDERDLICLTATQSLDGLTGDAFLASLDYLLHQAADVQSMISNLALQGANVEHELRDIEEIEQPETSISLS